MVEQKVSAKRVVEAVRYPRPLAVKVLTRVLSGREALDEVLSTLESGPGQSGQKEPLNAAQMAWLQEICSGTLRWKGRLDSILDTLSLKKKPSGWLRKVLLLAAYQLLAQDRVHPGAVVSESVALIRKEEGEAPAKYANACLRKISDHVEQWRSQPFPGVSSPQAAQWASLPPWLWTRVVKQHGEDWAVGFSRACLERPELWVRKKTDSDSAASYSDGNKAQIEDSDENKLRTDGNLDRNKIQSENSAVPNKSFKLTGEKISDLPGLKEGELIVQDISSQTLVTEMAAEARNILNGKPIHVLDLCASPGGKSIALAWEGFQVTATDRVAKRMPLLRENISRAAPSVQVVEWEDREKLGTESATNETGGHTVSLTSMQPNWIFVDAPCSGTGIIRRHPDVRWLREEKELAALTKTQEELLSYAMDRVAPGGLVSYSVCSILSEEGPEILSRLKLEDHVVKTWFLAPHIAPHGDGFWGVLLRKT